MVHSTLHRNVQLPLPTAMGQVALTGQRGVALFFIVSAFTLFLSYDNRKEERHPTRNFFIRRFFRLAPMFYIAVALSFFFLRTYAGRRREIALALVFLNGFTPQAIMSGAAGGWSVADEAIFYACLPFLFAKIKTLKTALIWLFIGSPLGYILGQFLSHKFPGQAEFFQFFSFSVEFPVFLLGIAGYFIWKETINGANPESKKNLSVGVLAVTVMLYRHLLPFTYPTLYQSSVVCLLLLIGLSLYSWPIFVNPVTRLIGKISYSIYLLHFLIFIPLQDYLYKRGMSAVMESALCFSITLLVTIPLAFLSWRYIEEPGIRLGRRIIAHFEGVEIRTKDVAFFPPAISATAEGNSPDAQF
jgi:peptidoglycan/LPS O-acetylase OafA/YrhL